MSQKLLLYHRSLLAICTLAAASASVACAQIPQIDPVALYISHERGMPEEATKAMREELDWIVAPVGLTFSWRNYGDTSQYQPVVRLAVVHFKGRCDTEDLTVYSQYPWKLGWTHTVNGRVIPYVDVFCDAIRAYLASGLDSLPRADRDARFGRAVGRVLAHELYHVFAETRRHGYAGLAKAACSPEELLSEDFRLSSKELQILRAVFAQTVLLGAGKGMPPEGEQAFAQNGCVGCHGSHGEGTARGPSFETTRMPTTIGSLRSRLNDSRSSMHRAAQKFGLSWSKLSADDLGKILWFLRSKTSARVSMEATPD